ncbi:MAG TPA: hypothetical protein VM115_05805 [Vicinamibacterales bacterium]|nr:hypothetical protein [Vicinamibacterales bacterium]
MKKPLIIKLAVGAVAIGVFAVLFMRSLEDTRTEAYTVPRAHLQGWTLELQPAATPADPLLVLRAPADLATGLFKQIFARAMESLNTPVSPSIPIVLRAEFDRDIGDRFTPEALLAAANKAGLGTGVLSPRCLVHRRVSGPGGVRQAYLVLLDAPALVQFRRQIGVDAEALSPVLFVAGAGADFNTWLPLRIDPAADCLAPIEIAP